MITNIRIATKKDILKCSYEDIELLAKDLLFHDLKLVGDEEGRVVRVNPIRVKIKTITIFELIR